MGIERKELDLVMTSIVNPISESIIRSFERSIKKPESASAEFGLGVTGDGKIFMAKSVNEANIRITVNWRPRD